MSNDTDNPIGLRRLALTWRDWHAKHPGDRAFTAWLAHELQDVSDDPELEAEKANFARACGADRTAFTLPQNGTETHAVKSLFEEIRCIMRPAIVTSSSAPAALNRHVNRLRGAGFSEDVVARKIVAMAASGRRFDAVSSAAATIDDLIWTGMDTGADEAGVRCYSGTSKRACEYLNHVAMYVSTVPVESVADDDDVALHEPEPTAPVANRNALPAARSASTTPSAECTSATTWIVDGLIATRDRVLVLGDAKAGKSTLLFGLVAALERGDDFVGRATKRATCFLVSEEFSATVAEKLKTFNITSLKYLGREDQLAAGDVSFERWIAHAVEQARVCGATVLIVDSINGVARPEGDDEQSSGAMRTVTEQFARAAAKGIACVALHHTTKSSVRKGERGVGSSRGSSVLVADVESVFHLGRARAAKATRSTLREITISTRHVRLGGPERLVIELRDGKYVAVGSEGTSAAKDSRERILDALASAPAPLTRTATRNLAGVGRDAFATAFDTLLRDGVVVIDNSKRKGMGRPTTRYRVAPPPTSILPLPQGEGGG